MQATWRKGQEGGASQEASVQKRVGVGDGLAQVAAEVELVEVVQAVAGIEAVVVPVAVEVVEEVE